MDRSENSDKFVALLKETVDGVGRLMTGHLKLARLELFAELKTLGRQIAIVTVAVAFGFFGYTLCCLGLAVITSRWLGLYGALFLLGGLHLAGGVTALLFVTYRLRHMHLMQETKIEATKSVTTLTDNIVNGSGPTAAASERNTSNALSLIGNTSRGGTHCQDTTLT